MENLHFPKSKTGPSEIDLCTDQNHKIVCDGPPVGTNRHGKLFSNSKNFPELLFFGSPTTTKLYHPCNCSPVHSTHQLYHRNPTSQFLLATCFHSSSVHSKASISQDAQPPPPTGLRTGSRLRLAYCTKRPMDPRPLFHRLRSAFRKRFWKGEK